MSSFTQPQASFTRTPQGRNPLEIRPLSIKTQVNKYAEGSALIQMGETHVLCTASIEDSVPAWLKGKGKGWLTAEYSMLPRATHTRTKRDREKVSGRTQEIQRLIGRALRSTVDLAVLGERSLTIDCDVIQADGGTRTASITGGCIAALFALQTLVKAGKIPPAALLDTVAAVSIGMKQGQVLVDLDYNEDSSCDVDMNFVMTGKGGFVEIQGTGEHKTFSQEEMGQMTESAMRALKQISEVQRGILREAGIFS